ncbi:MAG TPA: T9SS type A sorting domain-containing protein [Bacteroidia bacterium]|jgi:hypothetical protein|nr:T9SS type A sorting domain-containing protein [Bacteroidia bacterium]
MKKTLCLLLGLIVSFNGLSQQSFFKYCNSPSFVGLYYDVAETDSGYLAVGTVGIAADPCINFTDYSGQLIKQVLYNTTSEEDCFNRVISTYSGGAIALGGINATVQDPKSYTSIVNFDASANIVWSKKIVGNTQVSLSNVICNRQGYFVGAGTWEMDPNNVDLEFMIFDSLGNILLQKTAYYSDSSNFQSGGDMVRDIVETDDGGYVFLCSYDNDPTQLGYNPQVYLYKTDSALNFMWATSFPTNLNCQGFEIVKKDNGNLLYSSSIDSLGFNDMKAVLTEVNSSGNILWRKSYDITAYGNFQPYHLVSSTDSTIVCQSSVDGYMILFEIDGLGNVNWAKKYLNQNDFMPGTICKSSDNGLLIPGNSFAFPYKPELLKLSSGGNTTCGYSSISIVSNPIAYYQYFGIHNESTTSFVMQDIILPELQVNSWLNICGSTDLNENILNNEFVIYPNPVHDIAYLNLYGYYSKDLLVKIFNSIGQIVDVYSPYSLDMLELDLSKLDEGLYVAQLTDEYNVVGQVKFVVQ